MLLVLYIFDLYAVADMEYSITKSFRTSKVSVFKTRKQTALTSLKTRKINKGKVEVSFKQYTTRPPTHFCKN